MTKNKKVLILASVLIAALAVGLATYSRFSHYDPRYVKGWGTPESWESDKQNKTVISADEQPSKQNLVTIDFGLCSKGNDSFGFGLGSTTFYFTGIEDTKCHFYMGTEVENPNWDGFLDYECFVPIDYSRDFLVQDDGANLTFANEYCSK